MQQESDNKALFGIIAVVVIGLIVGSIILFKPKNDSSSSNDTSQTTSNTSSSVDPASTTYKNGTFSGTGSYTSPGGQEQIEISITITDNKVTASTATTKAASSESKEFQGDFVNGYKELVVGKDVATLKLSKVSGSSLTSRGFNEALSEIRAQAKI